MWHDIHTDIIRSKIQSSKKQLEYIKKSKYSIEKQVHDYKAPIQYVQSEYPLVDISNISVYETTKTTLNQVGIKFAAGIYFSYFKTVVLVRQKDLNSTAFSGEHSCLFEKYLFEKTFSNELEIDDVAVHEFLHAVSQKCRPVSSDYTSQEEQFVYTSSVKYFRQKGLLDKEIIWQQFLPNCVNDILASDQSIKEIVNETANQISADYFNWKSFGYHDLIKEVPEILANNVINKAVENAQSMINYYDEHGIKCISENKNIDKLPRSSLINFD